MIKIFEEKKYLVITGNYGSGKTEIALNLAFTYAKNQMTTLVDLDIVNPYFRSGEKVQEAERKGIRMLMPTYAMTTVDIPALPAEIQSVFEKSSDRVIFDVGGDDTGAAALGRYYPSFMSRREETTVAMVINCMRPLTGKTKEIIDLAERIMNRGRLKIDLLINNTNLAEQTTAEMIEEGEQTVLECGKKLGIRKFCTTGKEEILHKCRLRTPSFSIQRYMIPEWMEEKE